MLKLILQEIADVRHELKDDMKQMKTELQNDMRKLDEKLSSRINRVEDRMSSMESELRGLRTEVHQNQLMFMAHDQLERRVTVLETKVT